MRPFSAPHRALLGGATVEYHQRVEVQNESGTWINLSDLSGLDWVDDVSGLGDIDQAIEAGTLTLFREHVDTSPPTPLLSLAPFQTGSPLNVDDLAAYSPLIHPGRGFRIWVAPMAADAGAPAYPGASWHKIFDGRMDRPQWGPGDTISVAFRDLGSWLADTIIEEERDYGATTGIPVEDVMQQILDDNGFSNITLVMPGGPPAPAWMLRPYTQARVPVLEAIRALALQIGWDLRYRWGAGDTSELQFYAPDRNAVFADLVNGITLGPDEYTDVVDMQIGDEDVRNFGRLIYVDGGTGTKAEVTAFDSASIAVFRRRYIEISEGSSSNIDTAAEAQNMIDAVIADLSTPFADHAVETFLLWPLQLGDSIQFEANDVHYDADQTYAIVRIAWRLSGGHMTSTLYTRGKPAGGYRTWINMHGLGPGGRDGIPAPKFTFLLGEESHGGGVSEDGMAWIGVEFDPDTEYIVIFGEEGDNANTPTPDISENAVCLRLARPEGDIGQDPRWKTIIGIATRPFRWRKIRAVGYSAAGVKGPDWIPPAVEAADPTPAIADGTIQGFTINPVATLSKNVLDVRPGTLDPSPDNFICVRRDGVDLTQLFIGTDTAQKFIDDTAINPNARYTYEVFIWNKGVSGKHRRHGTGLPATPDFDFADQTPRLVWDDIAQKNFVKLAWAITGGAYPTADHVVIEYGKNGVNFPTELTTVAVGSSPYLDANTKTKFYRLRLEDAANAILAYSNPGFLDGSGIPPSWGGTALPVWNPVPTAQVFNVGGTLGTALLIGFICPTSGAVECSIEYSTDNGVTDPWTELFRSAKLSGGKTFSGDPTILQYYRLRSIGPGDVTLAVSASKYWDGVQSI
jgi:hypothetical protein